MCFRIFLAFSSILLMGWLLIKCTKGQNTRKRKKKPASSTKGDSPLTTVTGATAETIVETPDGKSKETDGTPIAKSAASAPVVTTGGAVLNQDQLDNTQSNNTIMEVVPKEENRSGVVPVDSVQIAPSQYGEKIFKMKKDRKAKPVKQEQDDSLSSLKPSKKEAKRSAEILKTKKVPRKHPDYKTIQSNAMSDFDKTLSQAPPTSAYEAPKPGGRK
uniref:Uncharacterized protein n=1 Tax=Ditylenchus dipsaci TaxID=166011 RepID=A0A915D8Q7_9BILA